MSKDYNQIKKKKNPQQGNKKPEWNFILLGKSL